MDQAEHSVVELVPPTALVARRAVLAVEDILLRLPQVHLPVEQYFAQDLYARSMFVPKDTAWSGAVHKKGHFVLLLTGEMTVILDEGPITLVAPCIFSAPAGVKRAGRAHEDSILMTIHSTSATNIDEIVEELVDRSLTEREQP